MHTVPKPFVFVLMPFDEALDDVYNLGIKPACEHVGAYSERVDEQIFEEPILQRIYNQIAKSDLIIADMTGRNPNVFYEVGYAHALGKPVILLTQRVEDIPFDLKHYPHIVYGGRISQLLADLEMRAKWHLANKERRTEPTGRELALYFGGVELSDGVEVPVTINPLTMQAVTIADFSITNCSASVYRSRDEDIALIVPRGLSLTLPDAENNIASAALPDGRVLHAFGPIETLLPQSWSTVRVSLYASNGAALIGQRFELVARHFTEFGPRDVSFFIVFVREPVARTDEFTHYRALKVENQWR